MAAPLRGFTREYVRQVVAQDVGDFILLKATSGGDPSTVHDYVNLPREYMAYRQSQILVRSAENVANVGETRVVTASLPDERTISFNPPLPEPVSEGDVIEMVNIGGRGWTIDQYNRAIDAALAAVTEEHAVFPVTYEVTDPAPSSKSPFIEIPPFFTYFSGINYSTRDGDRMLEYRYWKVDRYTRRVRVLGPALDRLRRSTITLYGSAGAEPLQDDQDRTYVPLEWLITEVKAKILEADVSRGVTNSRDRLFPAERQGADGRRTITVSQHGPNTVRLL